MGTLLRLLSASGKSTYLNDIVRIADGDLYLNMPVPTQCANREMGYAYDKATRHINKSEIIFARLNRSWKPIPLSEVAVFSDPVIGFRNPCCGTNPITGTIIVGAESNTEGGVPGIWDTIGPQYISRSTDNGRTFVQVQVISLAAALAATGNGYIVTSSTVETYPDGTMSMSFYGGNSKYGLTYESTDDGLSWVYAENAHLPANYDEFSHKPLGVGKRSVGFARQLGVGPVMQVRNDTGWISAGLIPDASPNDLVYGCELSADGSELIASGFDRSQLVVPYHVWKVADILDAINLGNETDIPSLKHRTGSIFIDTTRSKDPSESGYNGNSGNSVPKLINGQMIIMFWSIRPSAAKHYRGAAPNYDEIPVDLIVVPLDPKNSFIKTGTAIIDVADGSFTQVPIGEIGMFGNSVKRDGDDMIMLKDDLFSGCFTGMLSLPDFDTNTWFQGKVEVEALDHSIRTITTGDGRVYAEEPNQMPTLQIPFSGPVYAGEIVRVYVRNEDGYHFTCGTIGDVYGGLPHGFLAWTGTPKLILNSGPIAISDGANGGSEIAVPLGIPDSSNGYIDEDGIALKDFNLIFYLVLQFNSTAAHNWNWFDGRIHDAGDPDGRVQNIALNYKWHKTGMLPILKMWGGSQIHKGERFKLTYTPFNGQAYDIGGSGLAADSTPQGLTLLAA